MEVHASLSAKFSRLEELVAIITESINGEHVIDRDKIDLVKESVDEALDLSKALINNKEYHGLYDLAAGHWLVTQRAVIKEAHGDLSLPWNQPNGNNPNVVHGVSGEDDGDPQTFEGGLNFMNIAEARRIEKERLSDE